ncbi:MAG TPA: SBBP repeat-containing protein [Bryobacteraceae bacterium]|nr:SBBP repeat-containing protein [Bryobacteraceae bacterium]
MGPALRYPPWGVYPGVDLVYYGKEKQLEYDFIVAPGADLASIKLDFEGAKRVRVEPGGDLVVAAEGGDLRFHRPVVYQEIEGRRVTVPGRFRTTGSRVAFSVGKYRRDPPLVIDPVLSYSTYLGGSGDDQAVGIGVDAAGNTYVGGTTTSIDFPTTAGALDTQLANSREIFVAKLNPTGTTLLYATFIGGPSEEQLHDLAVDSAGNVFLTGYGQRVTTPGAYIACGSCVFAAKISSAADRLVYLTGYVNAGFYPPARIALGSDGSAYVAINAAPGETSTAGAYQRESGGAINLFITRLNPTGTGCDLRNVPGWRG